MNFGILGIVDMAFFIYFAIIIKDSVVSIQEFVLVQNSFDVRHSYKGLGLLTCNNQNSGIGYHSFNDGVVV